MTSNENKAVVQEFYDQWTAGEIDLERLVADDVTNHQPDRPLEVGLDCFPSCGGGSNGRCTGLALDDSELIAEGDFVVCHNSWSGTYGGRVFRGVPTPEGKSFSVEHIHIYRLEDGRIAEHWVVRDDLAMMLQLGAIATVG